MGITVSTSGPLFDGRAAKEMDKVRQDINEEIGQEVYDAVTGELKSVLQHPTGYYQSRIQVERAKADVSVNDSGVIYGPWLEGVGSRNRRSRFKGYSTFRRMTQKVSDRAEEIADKVMDRHIGRMQ